MKSLCLEWGTLETAEHDLENKQKERSPEVCRIQREKIKKLFPEVFGKLQKIPIANFHELLRLSESIFFRRWKISPTLKFWREHGNR